MDARTAQQTRRGARLGPDLYRNYCSRCGAPMTCNREERLSKRLRCLECSIRLMWAWRRSRGNWRQFLKAMRKMRRMGVNGCTVLRESGGR